MLHKTDAQVMHSTLESACRFHSMAATQTSEAYAQGVAGPPFIEIAPPSPTSPQLLSQRSGGLPPLHGMRQNMRSKSSGSLLSSFLQRTRSINEYAPSCTTNGDGSVSGHESPLSPHTPLSPHPLDAVRPRAVTDTGGSESAAGNDGLYTVRLAWLLSLSC